MPLKKKKIYYLFFFTTMQPTVPSPGPIATAGLPPSISEYLSVVAEALSESTGCTQCDDAARTLPVGRTCASCKGLSEDPSVTAAMLGAVHRSVRKAAAYLPWVALPQSAAVPFDVPFGQGNAESFLRDIIFFFLFLFFFHFFW